MAKAKRTQIQNNLLEQLKFRQADSPVFLDLVADYMALWDTKEMLIKDIKENGVKMKYDNGGGQCGIKENPSIKQQISVNAQMLKILSQLDISTNNIASDVDDEL